MLTVSKYTYNDTLTIKIKSSYKHLLWLVFLSKLEEKGKPS